MGQGCGMATPNTEVARTLAAPSVAVPRRAGAGEDGAMKAAGSIHTAATSARVPWPGFEVDASAASRHRRGQYAKTYHFGPVCLPVYPPKLHICILYVHIYIYIGKYIYVHYLHIMHVCYLKCMYDCVGMHLCMYGNVCMYICM